MAKLKRLVAVTSQANPARSTQVEEIDEDPIEADSSDVELPSSDEIEEFDIGDEPNTPSPLKAHQPSPKRRRLSPPLRPSLRDAVSTPAAERPDLSARASRGRLNPTIATPHKAPRFTSTTSRNSSITPASHLTSLRTPIAHPTTSTTTPRPRPTPRFVSSTRTASTSRTPAPPRTSGAKVRLDLKFRESVYEDEIEGTYGDTAGRAENLGMPGEEGGKIPETPSRKEFVPGGLADTVRGWIVGVGEGVRGSGGGGRRFVVSRAQEDEEGQHGLRRWREVERDMEEEDSAEAGSRTEATETEQLLLLLGNQQIVQQARKSGGKFDPSPSMASPQVAQARRGAVVELKQPAWQVDLGDRGDCTVGLHWTVTD